ncbi:MAG: transcriptional regulator [Burkholderiales bacterium 70-64]|nr:MAG: transcriptional regulator [Burkholderiales bacterium 70-64]
MDIKPIKTDADYRDTLAEIETLMGAGAGTSEGDRLDVLVTLVEAWERRHFPMDLPDPIETIRLRMEQRGLTPTDLEPMIGRLNRVYEVLNRKRPLTLRMIRRLHADLDIPADGLIGAIERGDSTKPNPRAGGRRAVPVSAPRARR